MSKFNNDIVELAIKVIVSKCDSHKIIMGDLKEKDDKVIYNRLKKQRSKMLEAVKTIKFFSGSY